MSVNSLNRRWKKILVEDEMESIFHLLVYLCVRFLPTNVQDVPQFIHDYFDAYVDTGDWFICGKQKNNAMITGQILLEGGSPLKVLWDKASADTMIARLTAVADPRPGNTAPRSVAQGVQSTGSPPSALGTGASSTNKPTEHPINAILNALLQSFHAYYSLCHEDNPDTGAHASTPPAEPEPREAGGEDAALRDLATDDITDILDDLAPRVTVTTVGTNPPMTAEQRKSLESRAALIQSHQGVINLFWSAMRGTTNARPEWPKNDKIEDRLPRDWHPGGEGQTLTDTGRQTTGGIGQMKKSGGKRSAPPDGGEGHGKRSSSKRLRGNIDTYESGSRSGASSRATSGAPPG